MQSKRLIAIAGKRISGRSDQMRLSNTLISTRLIRKAVDERTSEATHAAAAIELLTSPIVVVAVCKLCRTLVDRIVMSVTKPDRLPQSGNR